MLWHEEVFSVAWSYRETRPHTLANVRDSGELITRILEVCGAVVFRGGSSRRKSRQREYVLVEMVRHMRENRRVVYGVTVDGSNGPLSRDEAWSAVHRAQMRQADRAGAHLGEAQLALPTWDRMAIPLPFNHIRQYLVGPYLVPDDGADSERFEAFRRELEVRLVELAESVDGWPT